MQFLWKNHWTFCAFMLLPVSALFSDTALVPQKPNFSGSLYCGAQLGPAIYNGIYVAQQGVHTLFFEAATNSTFVGGTIGTDARYDIFYTALEGNLYYDTLDQMLGIFTSQNGIPNHIVKVKSSLNGGGIVKIGLDFNGTVPYFLFGSTVARWTLGLENDSAIAYTRGIQPQASMFFNHTLYGYRYGGGVRFPVYGERFYFDMQYAYNTYGNLAVSLRDLGSGYVWTHTLSNNQHTVLFGLNLSLYNF